MKGRTGFRRNSKNTKFTKSFIRNCGDPWSAKSGRDTSHRKRKYSNNKSKAKIFKVMMLSHTDILIFLFSVMFLFNICLSLFPRQMIKWASVQTVRIFTAKTRLLISRKSSAIQIWKRRSTLRAFILRTATLGKSFYVVTSQDVSILTSSIIIFVIHITHFIKHYHFWWLQHSFLSASRTLYWVKFIFLNYFCSLAENIYFIILSFIRISETLQIFQYFPTISYKM